MALEKDHERVPRDEATRSLTRASTIATAAAALALAGGGFALLRSSSKPGPPQARWVAVPSIEEAEQGAAALDLRGLNERAAGDNGFIAARGGQFVQLGTGAPIRFWGVNGPPRHLSGEPLRRCARMLARRGVNLVRIHTGYFDERGEVDHVKVRHALEVVEALKAEGIYTLFSIYYPLWLAPAPGTPWLSGYDRRQHPFAALMFNRAFQERYRDWWRALLLTPSPRTGRRLVDEPAVAAVEIQNEDSLLFPTLESLPDDQLRLLEGLFGRWLLEKHGSMEATLAAWSGSPMARDAPDAGRFALRPFWKVVRERTPRDRDTVRFLVEAEAAFYADTYAFLRSLGFRGLIGTSNWKTADDRILGPLEKLVATGGDFMDRHGYFGAARDGEDSTWALRPGQTFVDRSALRFDGEQDPGARDFESPAMDPRYGGKPSVLSEVSWERPNRFRAEATLALAAYGSLQQTGAILPFGLESERWTTRIRGTATPWPLTSPGQLGQFPAAALLFRRGLVAPGGVVAQVALDRGDLFALRGTPLPQGAPFPEGELRQAVNHGPVGAKQRLDPLLHFVGAVEVEFVDGQTTASAHVHPGLIDHGRRLVRSTTGELALDYQAGLLVIDAPQAQGAVGALNSRDEVATSELRIASSMETGTVVAVALDGRPLGNSERILLQVMSEEQATGFRKVPAGPHRWRIADPGDDPWQVREIQGTVSFTRPDAASLRITALDLAGRPERPAGDASRLQLLPAVFYYLIER